MKIQFSCYLFTFTIFPAEFYLEWINCWANVSRVAEDNELAVYLRDNISSRKSRLMKDNDVLLSAMFIDPRINYGNKKFYSTEMTDKAKVMT